MNIFSSSSSLPSPKIIAVVGATGNQGGATVKAFHALSEESSDQDFQIRAITRDPTSDKAKAIEPLVHEVVKADADDVASMVSAFKGCYGAFLVSNFWEDFNVDHEMQILRNLKQAVKEAGVKHVVLSTLESSVEFVDGLSSEEKDTWKFLPDEEKGMYVPHFDGKWEVTKEFMEDGIPVTALFTSFYFENFFIGMGPSRQSDTDPYALTMPMGDAKLQMVAVADIGKAACAIFKDSSLIGKTVGVRSVELTVKEIADVFTSVCGVPVGYNSVPWDIFATFPFPGAAEFANMFRFYAENEETFSANRDTAEKLLETVGGATVFEEWLTANKDAFKLEETPQEEYKPPQSECCEQCTIS